MTLDLYARLIGTRGGRTVRAKLAAASGRNRPAALIEDPAVGGARLIVVAAS